MQSLCNNQFYWILVYLNLIQIQERQRIIHIIIEPHYAILWLLQFFKYERLLTLGRKYIMFFFLLKISCQKVHINLQKNASFNNICRHLNSSWHNYTADTWRAHNRGFNNKWFASRSEFSYLLTLKHYWLC